MNQWRTLGLAVFSLLTLVVAIGMKASNEAIREVASAAIWMVGALAGRSAVEALGKGNGVKGAVGALMTDAKPGEG
jgi:hypothetical protein